MTSVDAVAALRSHHASLSSELRARAGALISVVELGQPYAGPHAHLEAYVAGELLSHAQAEEQVLYRAADTGNTAPLVRAMLEDHEELRRLAHALANAPSGIRAATAAYALQKLFEVHLRKENDILVPSLVQRGVDLGRLLEGMHEVLGRRDPRYPAR